jgi:hypothetical protein
LIDVVKTRLQVEARKGQASYKGLADAFVKICERQSFSNAAYITRGILTVFPAFHIEQTRKRASRRSSRVVPRVLFVVARNSDSLYLLTSTCTRYVFDVD